MLSTAIIAVRERKTSTPDKPLHPTSWGKLLPKGNLASFLGVSMGNFAAFCHAEHSKFRAGLATSTVLCDCG